MGLIREAEKKENSFEYYDYDYPADYDYEMQYDSLNIWSNKNYKKSKPAGWNQRLSSPYKSSIENKLVTKKYRFLLDGMLYFVV